MTAFYFAQLLNHTIIHPYALQSSFEADPSSSQYVMKMAPKINEVGEYTFTHDGRNIRVYSYLDVNLMFTDFFAKLELFNQQSHSKTK